MYIEGLYKYAYILVNYLALEPLVLFSFPFSSLYYQSGKKEKLYNTGTRRKWVRETSMFTRGQRKRRRRREKRGCLKGLQETKEYVKSEMGKWNDFKRKIIKLTQKRNNWILWK